MKSFLIIAIYFLLVGFSFSQNTKFKTKSSSNTHEEFYVLKSDNKTRHGSYIKYTIGLFNTIYINETGQYSYGLKEGIWKRYDGNNELKELLTYEDDLLNGVYILYHRDTIPPPKKISIHNERGIKNDSMIIELNDEILQVRTNGFYRNNKKDSTWTYYYPNGEIHFEYSYSDSLLIKNTNDSIYNLNINTCNIIKEPIYIGGGKSELTIQMFPIIYSFFKFQNLSIKFSFYINKKGYLQHISILESTLNKFQEKKIIKSIELQENWIPKKINGNFIESNLIFTYKINVRENKISFSID